MRVRVVIAAVLGLLVAGAILALSDEFRPVGASSTAVCVGVVVFAALVPPLVRRSLDWLYVVPAVSSLVVTADVLLAGRGSTALAGVTILEVVALLLVLIHVVRWNKGSALPVVACLTVAAQVLWLLRYMPGAPWSQQLSSCVWWALGSAVAVAFGGYPRWATRRLNDSVAAAKVAQQRQLERDLHDYVAHDLSGIIVQAQAARFATADDPEAMIAALRRIEEAGHRAMSSMDRALRILRSMEPDSGAPFVRHPGLEELADLLERFRVDGSRVEVTIEGALGAVPREVGEVLYRTAAEALTNVRRHGSPTTGRVDVTVQVTPRAARLTVADESRRRSPGVSGRPRGGTGLSQLQDRVEALGGVLEAGATPTGWLVSVLIPFAGPEDR